MTGATTLPSSRRAADQRLAAVLGTSLYVAGVGLWGRSLEHSGTPLYLGAPPFKGSWRVGFLTIQWPHLWVPALLVAAGVAVLVPTWWAEMAPRLRFRWLLVGSWAWSFLWTVSLAATSDPPNLARPLLDRHHEYLRFARELDSPVEFVSSFLARLSEYPTHVRGHPPGAVLAFWGLDRAFPTDTSFAVALLVLAATAAPASLLAVRWIAGEAAARRVAVFAGLAPAVVWIGTSADALVMAVVAWAVCAAAFALEHRGRAAGAAAAAAGLATGVALTLSYGSMVLLAPVGALTVWLLLRRRYGTVAIAVGGLLVAPIALVAMGFDWVEGYRAVRFQYYDGVASERPQWYFALSNLAAFAVAVGPAAVAGLATLRRRRLWVLAGSALAGVALADLSAMSKGEVERIWLPVVPWVLVATASLRTVRTRRIWAAVTMGFTILLQWKLRPAW